MASTYVDTNYLQALAEYFNDIGYELGDVAAGEWTADAAEDAILNSAESPVDTVQEHLVIYGRRAEITEKLFAQEGFKDLYLDGLAAYYNDLGYTLGDVGAGEWTATNTEQAILDSGETVQTHFTKFARRPDILDSVNEQAETFTLTASNDQINEGDANTFTVTAAAPVAEDTTVTFQLSISEDGDTAQLDDFNAGAFNPVEVTIPSGETTATFDLTAISGDGTESSEKYSVLATVNGETLSTQVTILDGAAGAGQTFTLTEGLDIIPGMEGSNGNTVTSGNDTIIGVTDSDTAANTTFDATDLIDAGEGTDTLKVVAVGAAGTTVPTNADNVEILNLQSNETGLTSVDTSGMSGLTNLNVTKLGGALDADAGSSTDVDVSAKAAGAALAVDGGNNVNVSLSDIAGAADVVTVGGATAAKGDVTVDMTGAAYSDGDGDNTLSVVNVAGGKTINVTQSATSDASGAATDTTGATITQGAVNIVGNASTTEVTVNQDASVAEVLAVDAVTGTDTTQEVTFAAMNAGETASLDFSGGNTLTFTAKKDLTANEVASAFANIEDGDIQVESSASLGLYTDGGDGATADNGEWSSGEVVDVDATKSKVVFSNADNTVTAIAENGATTGVDSVGGKVAGTNAVTGVEGVLGVANGAVDVDDTAANTIKTITIDGYGAGSAIGAAGATATENLETLNLTNSGLTFNAAGLVTATADMTVNDSAATLALNVEKLGVAPEAEAAAGNGLAALTLTNAPTTLNVTSTGDNYVDMTAAATETLNVSGDGMLDIDNTDLAALKTVTVTETAGLSLNAGGANTIESVNTTGTTGTVTSTIDGGKATYSGGAGVDNVTLATTTALTKDIDLGAGDDLLSFAALNVTGSSATLSGGDGIDSLSMAVATADNLDASVQSFYTNFERLVLNDAAGSTDGSDDTITLDLANLGFTDYVTTQGTEPGGTPGTDDDDLVLDNMASNGTIVLAATNAGANTVQTVNIKDASTGESDVLNVETDAADGTDLGTLTSDDVESVNITANDTDTTDAVSTNTLELDADSATALDLGGDGNLILTLSAATTEVAAIDASDMTGALDVTTLAGDTGATTVTGGSAADTLTAQGANDVLIGGAGNDSLKVDGAVASAATLTGGEGIDSFDVSGFLAANGGAAVTITDLEAGETIKFNAAQDGANFATGKVELIEEATFSEFVQEAAAQADAASETYNDAVIGADDYEGGVAWFEFNNNTFIVQDVDGDGAFTDGNDNIVKLTGSIDLSNSSFSQTEATLEYIA